MSAKLMSRGHRTELISYEIFGAGKQPKIVCLHHMMQIRLLGTDRAIALARAGHVGNDLEPDPPAVTAPYVGLSVHHVPPFDCLAEIRFIDSNYEARLNR
jgi:hypothetical protein